MVQVALSQERQIDAETIVCSIKSSMERRQQTREPTGAFSSGLMRTARASTVSRDLLVVSADNGIIARFDGQTGAYKGNFVQGGQLQSPNGIAIAPKGDVIINDYVTHKVLRYGSDGTYKATLA